MTSGGPGGTLTATPVVSTNSPWFNELQLQVANSGSLTALSITIVVQRTPGVSYSGQYNTVGGQIAQTNSSTTASHHLPVHAGCGTDAVGLDRQDVCGSDQRKRYPASHGGRHVHRDVHLGRNDDHDLRSLLTLPIGSRDARPRAFVAAFFMRGERNVGYATVVRTSGTAGPQQPPASGRHDRQRRAALVQANFRP